MSPNQIDAIAPADSATGSVPVIVTNNGVTSVAATAQLQSVAPAFFSVRKYAIATDANGLLVGPASVLPGATPAVRGEVIVVYGTGFGPTSPAVCLICRSVEDVMRLPSRLGWPIDNRPQVDNPPHNGVFIGPVGRT